MKRRSIWLDIQLAIDNCRLMSARLTEEIVFTGKVEVDQPMGDISPRGDILRCRPFVSLLGKDVERRLQDVLSAIHAGDGWPAPHRLSPS
jgi:hypothetical protein